MNFIAKRLISVSLSVDLSYEGIRNYFLFFIKPCDHLRR